MRHEIQQNTEEWLSLRAGKVTASSCSTMMANISKGMEFFSDTAKEYAHKLAVERLTGKPILDLFTSVHLERGHEEEPIAREMYEELSFNTVENGAFYTSDDCPLLGASPDGVVNDNKGIEIKSVIYKAMRKILKRDSYPTEYKWQLAHQFLVCGFDSIDFIAYCSQYPEVHQLYVKTINREEMKEEIQLISERQVEFEKQIEIETKLIKG